MKRGNREVRPYRLLVVDDTATGRATVEAALARELYEIRQASSGADCLAMVHEFAPDLILLDVMMPGMDGFETCRLLRQDERTHTVPVVMVTALADNESLARGLEAGADDFLGKPFNKWELRARVAALIRLGAQQRELAERDRFSWVFENAGDGFVLVDRRGRMLNCNGAARRILGFHLDEVVDGDFVERATRACVAVPGALWDINSLASDAEVPKYLVRTAAATGYKEWLRLAAHRDPLDPDGVVLVNLRDVTQQMERQLRQMEFHVLVSHRLRTPLFGISGAMELLAQSRDRMPGDTERKLLDMAVASSRRLRESVEDVLTYAGERMPVEGPLAMSRFDELVRTTATEQGVANVAVVVDPALSSVTVPLGEVAMRTILRALVDRARRFHPSDAPAVAVSVGRGERNWVRIDVDDDGAMLTERQIARALEPVMPGDPLTQGETASVGLALSLVAARVRDAGGRCLVENRADGVGVRVRIEFPAGA